MSVTETQDVHVYLERAERLGLFPIAVTRIIKLTQREDATIDELEAAVVLDAVLAARVLKVVNSPLYGLRYRVGTLKRALQYVGFSGTRDLVVAMAVQGSSQRRTAWSERLWRHAMATAWLAKTFARYTRGLDGDALFVAGLLHDFGAQLYVMLEPDRMQRLLDVYWENPTLLVHAEQQEFGVAHPALGAACLRRWNLPGAAVDLVERHHEPVLGLGGHAADPRSRAILAVSDGLAEPLLDGEVVGDLMSRLYRHPAHEHMRVAHGSMIAALELLIANRDEIVAR